MTLLDTLAHRASRLAACLVALALVSCDGGGGPAAPAGLSYPSPQNLRLGVPISPVAPTVNGAVARYSVSPGLPAGLTIDPTSGQISGTPVVAAAVAAYTVVATNEGGSTAFPLALKVYALQLDSGPLIRMTAQRVSIAAEVMVRPLHFDVGTLYASATDTSGLFLPTVGVAANTNGTYTLTLSTNPSIEASTFGGSVTISLCRDVACSQPQDVPSVAVPYSVRVVAPASAWPGDNLKPLVAWPGVSDWTTVQGNAAHTGFVPAAVRPDDFSLRWKGPGNDLRAAWGLELKPNLVTWNGLFFVASSQHLEGGVVYAKREHDGSEVWRYEVADIPYPTANPVAVSDGVVHFAVGHQLETYMVARNAANGAAVYRATMSSQWENYLAPTVGPNGMLYANAGMFGGLYGFNPAGQRLFSADQSMVTNWTPAVDATHVYAYTGDRLQLIDPLTGVATATIVDPTFQNYVYDNGGAPVLGSTALGSVFGAAYTNAALNNGDIGNSLTNFRTTTGTIAWQVRGAYPTTPAYRDGVVFAANHRPLRLEARAENDGTLLWSWTPPSGRETSFVSEVLLTRSHVFISTNYATHAIDLSSHRTVWSYPASGKLALSANGVLYIHGRSDLIAVNLK